MNYKDISEENINNHIDRILDVVDEIKPHQITILTGGNATGKSVIRKQLSFHIQEKLEDEIKDEKYGALVASISMQLRTEQRPEFSAFSTIGHDLPWMSTGDTTIHTLNSLLKQFQKEDFKKKDKRYLVIDELEIGMSKEVQMGTCEKLNQYLKDIKDRTFGVLVITHSEIVVKNLKHDSFINIEGMSEEEWLNREITPIDPNDLRAWASALHTGINKRQKGK